MRSIDAMKPLLDRRALLQGVGALVVTFAIAPRRAGAQEPTPEKTEAPETAATKSVSADAVQGILAIDPGGRITVYAGKVDLGTGVETALMQIVADELDVPLRHVTLIQGDTALTPDQGPANSSFAIENGGMQLRHAAATLRAELLRRAAARLSADIEDLRIVDGLIHASGTESVDIGMLAAEAPVVL
jgi:nicotinate dehydrogenase subunit B